MLSRIIQILMIVSIAISGNAFAAKGGKGNGNGGGGEENPVGGDYTGTAGVTFDDLTPTAPYDVDITGGSGDDQAYGGDLRDYIQGLAGSDQLHGRGESDLISGGTGDDIILGGDGNDELNGDDGDDWLLGEGGTDSLSGGNGNDILTFSFGAAIPGGYEFDSLDGGDGTDIFAPGDSANQLNIDTAGQSYVLNVNDPDGVPVVVVGSFVSIEGAWGTAGDDLMGGSSGTDDFYGAAGNDTISGYDGDDILGGGEGNDYILGGPGDDILSGDTDSDYLDGGPGSDRIVGSERGVTNSPNDTLRGDTGCDVFEFDRESGVDTILDFEDNCDMIDVSAYDASFARLGSIDITVDAPDIIIQVNAKRGGFEGSTIILAGVAGSAVIDDNDFIIIK